MGSLFIEQLLQHCGRLPAPRSVLVMDNASFHHTERVKQICSDAGAKLIYPPPYSRDLNPIEELPQAHRAISLCPSAMSERSS